MKSVVIGTAGHIDHGKTSLVKALTGIDADRLEEEKRRGITIDLGFAHMDVEGEERRTAIGGAAVDAPSSEALRISFIDVPGHEKFVRNMLAGVGGVDLVMLVIAADEGVMPQTREHFDICRLLGIRTAVVALTKSDAVDATTLAVVRAEIVEFLRGSSFAHAEVVPVSALSGAGIAELRSALIAAARQVAGKDVAALMRMPIDRVFTMHGFGTVVTGTLLGGTIAREQEVEVVHGGDHGVSAWRARVRGVQVHGAAADTAMAGDRVAVNLAGIGKEELQRGDMIVQPSKLRASRRFDVALEVSHEAARPLKDRARVHLHVFASEVIAEVVLHLGAAGTSARELKPGESALAQLRVREEDAALLLVPGDRFVVRQFSPVVTIGGGVVLDSHPFNKKLSGEALTTFLETLRDGRESEQWMARVERRGALGLSMEDAVRETGWTEAKLNEVAATAMADGSVRRAGDHWITRAAWEAATSAVVNELHAFHAKNPLATGVGRDMLRDRMRSEEPVFSHWISALAAEKKVAIDGELLHLAGHKVVMRSEESAAQQTIEAAFRDAGLKVPAMKEVLLELPIDRIRAQKIVALLQRDKVLVKVSEELVFHVSALESLKRMLAAEKARSRRIEVGRFKELTGVSRKYAIPLLEWLDRNRITRRVGDAREIL